MWEREHNAGLNSHKSREKGPKVFEIPLHYEKVKIWKSNINILNSYSVYVLMNLVRLELCLTLNVSLQTLGNLYLKYVARYPQLYSDRFIVEFSVIVDEAISHLKFMFGTSAHPEHSHHSLIQKYVHSENLKPRKCPM